jgi:hypothetical protein
MPMRDNTTVGQNTTLALSGGLGTTVVQATPFDLVSPNPYLADVWIHVRYPANPTGTTPSIIAKVTECATSGGTYVDLANLHQLDAAITGFPKEYHQGMVPRLRFLKVSFTLFSTDNIYGTVQIWLSATAEERRSWP